MGGIFKYSYQPPDPTPDEIAAERARKRLEWKYHLDLIDIEKRDREMWVKEHGGPTPGGFGALFD